MATSTLDSLDALTSVNKADLVLVQDDPAGTPQDKKATVENLLKAPATFNDFDEAAAPATPSGSDVRIYAKTDGKMYSKDDAGTETLMSGGLGTGSNQLFEGRITPTTGVPIETADQASIAELFITPFEGDQVRIYDGSANWDIYTFSEITVKITNTKTGCAYTSGSAVITNITDTSDLLVNMVASGTGIPAGAVIASIDSSSQVTLDQNTTSTVPGGSVDFMIPADTNVDLFLYNDSGTIKHKQVLWTDATTRATALTTQDGIKVLTGQTGWLYIGKYRTRGTDGETDWDAQERNIQNHYNRRGFSWYTFQNVGYAVSSSSFVKCNESDNAKIYGLVEDDDFVNIKTVGYGAHSSGAGSEYYHHGIGIDSESSDSSQIQHVALFDSNCGVARIMASSTYQGSPAEGFHYFCGIEKKTTANNINAALPSLVVEGGFLG